MNDQKNFTNMHQTAALILTGCFLLGSCRSNPPLVAPAPVAVQSFSFPSIGVISTSDIGDELLNQETGVSTGAIAIPYDQPIGSFTIRKGHYAISGQNREYIKFSRVQMRNENASQDRLGDLFLFLKDASTKTVCVSRKICAELEYSTDKITNVSPNYKQYTLIYIGKVENKITLGYREFIGDTARPAFSNDVTYDLSKSNVLGYKGARIEVLDATNTGISYKVLSNFNR